MTGATVEIQAVEDWRRLQSSWLDLQQRADCSYFQTWGWMDAWLKVVQPPHAVRLLSVHHGERIIGLAILAPARLTRRRIVRSRALFLNEYPLSGNNMVIEYNGILAERGCEQQVYAQALSALSEQFPEYEEFMFGAVANREQAWLQQALPGRLQLLCDDQSHCYQAALDFDPPTLDGYLSALSRNTREQIRRSKRLYESEGELRLQAAASVEQALDWLDTLKSLHQPRWQAKGQRGAFANPRWENMQRELIRQRFAAGEMQLLQLRCGEQVIACLFNYIWRGRVYVLQMGFRYEDDNRIKPGYLAHALAIVHNRQQGHDLYDFMHGEARYKQSLSNRRETLHWLRLQRPKWKFRFENTAVASVRRLRNNTGG